MNEKETNSALRTHIEFLELQNKYLKKEHAQYLSLFDKGEVSLFKWNNDDTWSTAYASQNVYNLSGYTSEEFLKNEIDYSSIIYKDDLDLVSKEVMYALENDIDYFTHTAYRIVAKDGSIKWVLDNTHMIRDFEGKVVSFLGTISDITVLKNYKLNLEKMVKKKTDENILQKDILYRQNRLTTIGETIERIAHQWRQPLNHVGANISKLEMLNKKEFHNRDIEAIIDNSNKSLEYMSKTITDFSNYFAPQKEKKPFFISKAIEDSISIITPLPNTLKITYNSNIDGTQVYGHENELIQVILILLNNAKDAITAKQKKENFEGRIVINTELKDESIYISVVDNGGGIKTANLEKIFEPYFTTKFKSQGTGLGLYMSKMIIEKDMHGTIEAQNAEDGAIFKITLGHK